MVCESIEEGLNSVLDVFLPWGSSWYKVQNKKKAEIIARKEKEIQGWLNYSARLLGIVQESKAPVESMQKDIDGQDLSITKTISKTTQDLYKILSEGAPY